VSSLHIVLVHTCVADPDQHLILPTTLSETIFIECLFNNLTLNRIYDEKYGKRKKW